MRPCDRTRLPLVVLVLALAWPACFGADQTRDPARNASATSDKSSATNSAAFTNRLAREKSPYLLQHAHNPVDWYPWGPEAFAKARQENKPIFLSIGYSTCHWCHVMEHESFEDPAIARLMNRYFVNIKVDREERPDVDSVYMTFVQASTGGGGWPLNVWLTPDLKPFVGGTYLPPNQFTNAITRLADSWAREPARILAAGESVVRQLKEYTAIKGEATAPLEKTLLEKGFARIQAGYDSKQGGFSAAPKFPRPVLCNFLFRYHARGGNKEGKEALQMALFTLRKMAEGGMHDHLGGGFHRYSTDDRWHVPHFEKMLYDQAQLAISYLEAFQIIHEPFYAAVARDVLEYVRRDMTGEHGQFYSAEDADSRRPERPEEKAEGAFYVWEQKEIETALGKKEAPVFDYYYGVEKSGNVKNDPRGEFPNKNVLIVTHTLEQTAKEFDQTNAQIEQRLADARTKLFALRNKRPRPHLDDKAITAWNGLMISAFARGHQVLGESRYLEAAEKSAQFIRRQLYDPASGQLKRRYRAGESALGGYADDYAFLIQGLIDLYEASFKIEYLTWARDLQKKQNELFGDPAQGGYFSTVGNDDSILLRVKEDYDGAEPSPNSIAALNLLRLSEMFDDKSSRELARKTIQAFGERLAKAPSALPQMLVAVDFHLSKPKQMIVAGKVDQADTRAMLREISGRFIPNKVLLLADGAEGQQTLGRSLPFIKDMSALQGKATAYVCENYVCQLPVTDVEKLTALLSGKK